MFKKILASVGIGAAKVDTILETEHLQPGQLSMLKGTPKKRLPKATPNTNAGMALPANKPQSQLLRQRFESTLLR